MMLLVLSTISSQSQTARKPNILFCIADDASYQHMSAYGMIDWVKTPNFDRIAREGLLFTKAYTPNAKCSPSRAAILTGRNPWQLEAAGNHNPYFPAKFTTFIEVLGQSGYMTGYTGKGWGPGEAGMINGKKRELTGKAYNAVKGKNTPTSAMSPIDYAANFAQFLKEKPAKQSFVFWMGSHEPHRPYRFQSSEKQTNKRKADIKEVPPFWVDNDSTRSDMLDYALEVEYFDQTLGEVLEVLKNSGELDNTIIVLTSDNGMPFPRTKGHIYEHDNHLPLAISWKGKIVNPGRQVTDFVSFIDLAPTFLELAGVDPAKTSMQKIEGRSLLPFMTLVKPNPLKRDFVILGRERQDVGRPDDQGYPVRAIVKGDFVYAINYEPSRWPAGDPETGYMDTDNSPTKSSILAAYNNKSNPMPWNFSFGKKGGEELYQINKDPYSVNNLATKPEFAIIKKQLKDQLESELKLQGDPRMFGKGSLFDQYPYSKEAARNHYNRVMKGEEIKGKNAH